MFRLKKRFRAAALGAGSASVLILAAAPAAAQYYPVQPIYPPPPPSYGTIAVQEAESVVRSLGLTPLGPAIPRGPFFLVHAMGREGTPVRVMLDRRSGRVVQIVRTGPSAPRVAVMRPAPPPGYEPDDEESGVYEDNTGYVPPPPPGLPAPGGYYSGSGPDVITRDGQRGVTGDPEITGSIPRNGSSVERMPRGSMSGRVDPLLGVPKEFRGPSSEAKVAARTPAETPRATPLPRPRPADAPAVAQREPEPAPAPTAKPDPEKQPAPPSDVAPPAKDEYPVQPLE